MENKDELELVQNLDNNLNGNTEAQVNNQVPENNQEFYQSVEPVAPVFEGVNENIEPLEVIDNVVPSVEPVEMVEPVTQSENIETVASAPVVETEVVDIDEGNKKPDVVQEQVITEKEKENKENKAGMTLVIVILLILILVVLFLPQITELLSK